MLQFHVDTSKCTACGMCVNDCLHHALIMEAHPTLVYEEKCIRCQHCLAICPTGAISILGNKSEKSCTLKNNLPDPHQLETLVKGRRSVRHWKDKDVDPAVLQEILDAAANAPTGGNKRQLQVTVVDKRVIMDGLREQVYRRLETLGREHRMPEHVRKEFFLEAPQIWREKGQDDIFRGAPHCLIVSNNKDTTCPREDALIYLSYFELLAQSRGVGTLWCGLFYWCLRDILPELKDQLGIPNTHCVEYTMMFGLPAVHYPRTVEHTPYTVNTVQGWGAMA